MNSLIIIMIQIGTVFDIYCPQSSQIGYISGTALNELSFARGTNAAAVEESRLMLLLLLLLLLLLGKTFMAYIEETTKSWWFQNFALYDEVVIVSTKIVVGIQDVVIIAHGSVWRTVYCQHQQCCHYCSWKLVVFFSLCNKCIHTAAVTVVETFIICLTFVPCLTHNLMIRMTCILLVC